MKARDLYKLSDRDLIAALRTFNEGTTGNEASFGLTGAMSGNLKTKIDAYEAGVNTLDDARAAEDAAVVAKNDLRKDAVSEASQQMKLTRATPGIKSDDLASVGLDEYDTTPTDSPFAVVRAVRFDRIREIKTHHSFPRLEHARFGSQAERNARL